jgi:CRISPR-associated protein Cpf1
MNKLYKNLHNLFKISKTLRFELKPVGETQEHFNKNVLKTDEEKAEKFKKVKKYCDEYHKVFIKECLENFHDNDFIKLLTEYNQFFIKTNLEEKEKKQFEEIQKQLRNKLSNLFKKASKYDGLFKEELIKEYLKEYYKNDKDKLDEIAVFDKFTSYFKGFHTNRKNMYSEKEKHTAIAYRLINENLPIYLKNIAIFKKIEKNIPTIKEQIQNNLGKNCDNYFSSIEEYINCLSQKQIEEYNLIIAGKSQEKAPKIQGLNEIINLYNQKNSTKLPIFKELYKQILSDTNSSSFKFDIIEYDYQIIEVIKSYYQEFEQEILNKSEFIDTISNISQFDASKIYINNDNSLTTLSQNVFEDWSYIKNLLEIEYDKKNGSKKSKNIDKYLEKRNKELNKIKEISIEKIENLIKEFEPENSNKIAEYFKNKTKEQIEKIKLEYENVKTVLQKEYDNSSTNLLQDKNSVEKIKNFLDSIKDLQSNIKLLIPKNKTLGDMDFYNKLNYEVLSEIIPVYNKTRNYVTKKPYSLEKFKLNFGSSQLLAGWDKNKEESNLGVLLEKDGNYYLGIMNKTDNKIFSGIESPNDKCCYRKIEYKLLPKVEENFPRVFFAKSRIKDFEPTEELLFKYKQGMHKKGENFDLSFCHELIDFYKSSIKKHKDWSKFNFKFSDTNTYDDTSQFYREVETQGYKIDFVNISEEDINQLVHDGELYLFQIYNKDFSKYSKGKENLHTLYWKALFDKDNLSDVVYQLNGKAEIFYRKKSIEAKIIYKRNEPIGNKKFKQLKRYRVFAEENEPIENKKTNPQKETSVFEYDLIKDKRFTVDKFQFHVPITLNFKAAGKNKFNDFVNNELKECDDIHIIGIDRGERHLLYISVINSKGEIVEQRTLNVINDTNYHALLDEREDARNKARKSWNTIQNIKEIKEGYMSQVVNVLTKLMLKYNAIIVLEDLNSGFKNSRKKIEKQVYDKFETKLISKLEYLVIKPDRNKYEEEKFNEGGILNAYQLANSEIKNSKQNGIILYIPAWNTSKIDPTTGFVNLFNLKKVNNEFVEKFQDIRYNEAEDYFEFDFNYSDFSDKSSGERKNWTICTYGDRLRSFGKQNKNSSWDSQSVNLTAEFKKLFDEYKIDYSNIKDEILNKSNSKFYNAQIEKDNFYGFAILFKLLVQLRNSIANSEEDYILSPVKNKRGFFYDSRQAGNILPQNADANGAYNIARKGLILLNRIKENEAGEKLDYSIKNADWLSYVQEQDQ